MEDACGGFRVDLTGGESSLTKPKAEEALRKLSVAYAAKSVVQFGVVPILISVLAGDPEILAIGDVR